MLTSLLSGLLFYMYMKDGHSNLRKKIIAMKSLRWQNLANFRWQRCYKGTKICWPNKVFWAQYCVRKCFNWWVLAISWWILGLWLSVFGLEGFGPCMSLCILFVPCKFTGVTFTPENFCSSFLLEYLSSVIFQFRIPSIQGPRQKVWSFYHSLFSLCKNFNCSWLIYPWQYNFVSM